MSSAKSRFPHEIVHIRSDPPQRGSVNPTVQAIEGMLASAPLKTEVLTDVYRGLAHLCTSDSLRAEEASQPCAVFVCVDDLGPAELEFFVVLGRLCPDLPVYVYGMEHSQARVDKAVELGATGQATGGVIRSLANTVAAPPAETSEPPVQEEIAAVAPSDSPALADEDEDEDEADTLATDAPPVEETKTTVDQSSFDGSARVPWLRYADRPARRAPIRSVPVPPEALPDNQAGDLENQRQYASEPLLTDAELQALIGDDIDDIAAIAPEERQEPDVEARNEGKGEV